MTDVYTDTEYSVTMLAVLAEHRGFVIRKMPLRYGTGGLKMKEYEIQISGIVVVTAESEAEAIEEALTNGADEYYAEVIDSWEVEEG